jgi:diaminohydroxyphosphoribosylaminopyrimidine deaminase / 5-amino-6-(5-phosphoribosylamino)uracil reductase
MAARPSPSAPKPAPAAASAVIDEEQAWQEVLARRRGVALHPGHGIVIDPNGLWSASGALDAAGTALVDLYAPYAAVPPGRPFAVAHLAQSLDGRIATLGGASRWISGEADLDHAHRMRALADAVLVGAETVRRDDPQLTVRRCAGPNPRRVVLDPKLSLVGDCRVMSGGAADCLIVAAAEAEASDPPNVEVLRLPSRGGELDPDEIRAALAARGLAFLFIEGGGRTVSRFLAAGALDRLQLVVAPVILGSGRPCLALPEIVSVDAGLRPRTRRFELGEDVLFECIFRE